MKPNIGMTDKLLRYTAGVVLISLHLSGTLRGTLGVIFVATALVLLLTGMLKFCPVYHFLGKSTWTGEPRHPGKY